MKKSSGKTIRTLLTSLLVVALLAGMSVCAYATTDASTSATPKSDSDAQSPKSEKMPEYGKDENSQNPYYGFPDYGSQGGSMNGYGYGNYGYGNPGYGYGNYGYYGYPNYGYGNYGYGYGYPGYGYGNDYYGGNYGGYGPYGFDGYYGYGDLFGYDEDYDEVQEFIDSVEDKALKEQFQKLYDEYLKKQDEADEAWEKLEDAVYESGILSGDYGKNEKDAPKDKVKDEDGASKDGPKTGEKDAKTGDKEKDEVKKDEGKAADKEESEEKEEGTITGKDINDFFRYFTDFFNTSEVEGYSV